jgi:hypothetical protein
VRPGSEEVVLGERFDGGGAGERCGASGARASEQHGGHQPGHGVYLLDRSLARSGYREGRINGTVGR